MKTLVWLPMVLSLFQAATFGQQWSPPAIADSVSIRDGRSGRVVQFSEMLDALAKVDVVFLGETHTDETTHRLELAVYEELLQRRENQLVLGMEMFERDVQDQLDAYLGGELDEPTFLARSRPWRNYAAAYRPLIELARKTGSPVVASNFPRPLRMKMARQGPQVLQALAADQQQQSPRVFHPNTPAYWRRADNAVRGHLAMMRTAGSDQNARLYSTQSLWDNAMGEACADALDQYPDHAVLHVNGGFHTQYWDGTVQQFKLRKPSATVATVSIVPVQNPSTAELKGAPTADFVVFAEQRASDLNDGRWSVYVSRKTDYLLHLPDAAADQSPPPLLIWLSDDGLTAADSMAFCKARLGEHLAIAVIEPPYREIQEDLSLGGRWFWPDSFVADMAALTESIERAWGYTLRHYHVDPKRVCIGGEGSGGTVAAAVGVDGPNVDHGMAIEPQQYAKIKDFPLPLLEDWGQQKPPRRKLTVVGDESVQAWWAPELQAYTQIGIESEFVVALKDPWQFERQVENCIRLNTAVDKISSPTGASRAFILIDTDSPRARHWSRLAAQTASAADQSLTVVAVDTPPDDQNSKQLTIDVQGSQFLEQAQLPRCPGPFGGTTVVVLPTTMTPEERQRWQELEENDPLNQLSRFHRVRIATTDGPGNLQQVLQQLQDKNAKNVLIVPAEFCAEANSMRALRRAARDFEDQMTVHWLPGLGGQVTAESVRNQ